MMSSMRKPSSERPSTLCVSKCANLRNMEEEDRTLGHILQSNVQHGIVQGSAHQELQTQVVDSLSICKGLSLLCLVPFGDQAISECQTGRGIGCRLIAIEHATSKCSFDMSNDLFLKIFLVYEGLGLEFLPCGALWFGNRSC